MTVRAKHVIYLWRRHLHTDTHAHIHTYAPGAHALLYLCCHRRFNLLFSSLYRYPIWQLSCTLHIVSQVWTYHSPIHQLLTHSPTHPLGYSVIHSPTCPKGGAHCANGMRSLHLTCRSYYPMCWANNTANNTFWKLFEIFCLFALCNRLNFISLFLHLFSIYYSYAVNCSAVRNRINRHTAMIPRTRLDIWDDI